MNLMLDLETTGVEAGCCILSVAFVPFATDLPINTFYEKISHRASKDYGFTDDHDTLSWWDKQKKEIQEEAFSGIRDVESVLESITFYLRGLGLPKELHVWGNGKDFDNVILSHYFKRAKMPLPWHFRNNWCYRDLAKKYPVYPYVKPIEAHNALADAQAQATHAELIFQGVKRGIPPVFPN